jgi:hypothetical protein
MGKMEYPWTWVRWNTRAEPPTRFFKSATFASKTSLLRIHLALAVLEPSKEIGEGVTWLAEIS